MDVFTQRIVVVALALICVVSLAGLVFLAAAGHDAPQIVAALSATATVTGGALTGTLGSGGPGHPQNPPAESGNPAGK